mmetsp:Transcript_18304/g.17426  ORF Transcript_18304/g.17426 Transcript_18304/m.17426 type:complete len:120 (+) Transcript_18304:1665-2024(+)
MISKESNQDRNEVMRRIKFEQLKRRHLPKFIQNHKEEIMNNRRQKEPLEESSSYIPLMKDKKNQTFSHLKNPKESPFIEDLDKEEDTDQEDDEEVMKFKSDFVDYMKGMLTKGGVSTLN